MTTSICLSVAGAVYGVVRFLTKRTYNCSLFFDTFKQTLSMEVVMQGAIYGLYYLFWFSKSLCTPLDSWTVKYKIYIAFLQQICDCIHTRYQVLDFSLSRPTQCVHESRCIYHKCRVIMIDGAGTDNFF